MDLEQWNSKDLWRSDYGNLADGCLFIGEDIFGGQFCIKEGRIYAFDPETGQLESLAIDISSWLDRVIKDHNVLTGYRLAHAWQQLNGGLEPGKRLLPKTPFVLGGAFEVHNLYSEDAVTGMRFRGVIAKKIQTLPDGSRVELKVIE
jgi:outer membrane protein assembly factor BamB